MICQTKITLGELKTQSVNKQFSLCEVLCLKGNLWYTPPASMTLRLASVTFKMASKVVIEEMDKNFDFTTEILFRFLGFGDFEVSIVIEN